MNKLAVLEKINSQMRAVLAKEAELAGDPNDTSVGFEQMRVNYTLGRAFWNEGGPEMAAVCDTVFEVAGKEVAARIYYPTEEAVSAWDAKRGAIPAIVYAHGGGWVVGNLETHDRICRTLSRNSAAIVVAVDYHLAPEAKFPQPIIEVAEVAQRLHEKGAAFGIDGEALGIAGDSGGAHIALATTMYLRERKGEGSLIKSLLLFYGWFGLADSPSKRLLGGPWDGLTEKDWEFYLCLAFEDPDAALADPLANLFLNDLTRNMPACYIAAAKLDPLLDDSALLATICKENGVPCRYEVFEGVIHAFLHYTRMLDAANDALLHAATFYREALGLPDLIR